MIKYYPSFIFIINYQNYNCYFHFIKIIKKKFEEIILIN